MTILQRFLRLLPVCVLGCMPLGAFAGDLTVSGSVQATYEAASSAEVTGNPYGLDTVLTFTASSELDNGLTLTIIADIDQDDAIGDTVATMGAMGSVSGTCGNDVVPTTSDRTFKSGIGMVSPTTGPAAVNAGCIFGDHRLTIGGGFDGVDLSTIDAAGSDNIQYHLPSLVDGLDLGASYSPGAVDSGGGATDFAVTYTGVDGLSISLGEVDGIAAGDDEESADFTVSYTIGSVAIGYQNDEESAGAGADVDEYAGIQAAYTMGGMTISQAGQAETSYATANNDDEITEISLGLAF